MVPFSCSASASHGLKSAPIDPFSTAHTASFLRKMPCHRHCGSFDLKANVRQSSGMPTIRPQPSETRAPSIYRLMSPLRTNAMKPK
jgi:hypothetical protein